MKKVQVLLLAAIMLLLVLSTGCGLSDKIGEKIGETILEGVTSGDADIDLDTDDGGVTITTSDGTMQTGSDLDWPTDSMGDLPKINATFISVITNTEDGGANVMFEKMSAGDSTEYIATLKSLGYTNDTYEATLDDGGATYSASNSSGAGVFFLHNADETGSLTYAPPSADSAE